MTVYILAYIRVFEPVGGYFSTFSRWQRSAGAQVFNARSFIYAPDFPTPEALAEHLRSLTDADLTALQTAGQDP